MAAFKIRFFLITAFILVLPGLYFFDTTSLKEQRVQGTILVGAKYIPAHEKKVTYAMRRIITEKIIRVPDKWTLRIFLDSKDVLTCPTSKFRYDTHELKQTIYVVIRQNRLRWNKIECLRAQ